MHHYRNDETDVFYGSGAPTASADRPSLYIDKTTGNLYTNLGGGTTWYGAGGGLPETLAAARVLTVADSGKTFLLALAGGFDITLPALATTNFSCNFLVTVSPTSAYTLTGATADKIYGLILSSSGAAEDTAGVGDPGDVVNFVGNTALIGDRLTVTCNGTFYFVEGRCAAAGGITITG